MAEFAGVIVSEATTGGQTKALSNSDFRSLLTKQNEERNTTQDFIKGNAKAETRSKRIDSYKKWQERKDKRQKKDELTYRDRAKERREDANPDYQGVDEEKYASVTIEASKFLGGDLDHTHLVKGLDFALVQKIKEEQERKLESASEKEHKKILSVNVNREKGTKMEQIMLFHTAVGRGVYRIAVESVASLGKPTTYFSSGRLGYEFHLDPDFPKELPTTVIRPQYDAAVDEDRVTGLVDSAVRKKIEKVVRNSRVSSAMLKGKKKKKKDDDEHLDQEIKRKAMVSTEDDIFENVDLTNVSGQNQLSTTKGGYFDAPSKAQQLATQVEEMPDEEGDLEPRKPKRKVDDDDYYADPVFVMGGFESDDEDYSNKMDSRYGEKKKPWDFNSEEQWDRHLNEKEANPKAAFQYGLKMKDGRKQKIQSRVNGSENFLQRKQENKLNKELQQIQSLINKRTGNKRVVTEDQEKAAKRQKLLRGFAR